MSTDDLASLRNQPEPDPSATVVPAEGAGRFRIVRQHAKGGLGVVFVARDQELGREVALKEIQLHQASDEGQRRRFVREAEITGSLEHPGIVPVYGLGVYDDGRPYYAMRFIRGESLAQSIRQFHRLDLPGREASERNLSLRQLLRRLIDVANALDFAHSRGIIHRDLKPDNIMIGAFGETLVVDWGLAKVLNETETEIHGATGPASSETSTSATSSNETQMGQVVGTPAYMSPEQAEGRLDQLGPASDIFSLGGTLYTLLTGQLPFSGPDPMSVIGKVVRGEFPPPRQVKPGVPPALEAICLKAMAHDPAARYSTAKAMADEIEKWMADEPVEALRESLAVRTRRWMRKHPGPVAGIVATVAVALVGLIVGAVIVGQKNDLLRETNDDLRIANFDLDRARRDADLKRDEAEKERNIALAVREFLNNDLLFQADAIAQANQAIRSGRQFETSLNPTIRELLDRSLLSLGEETIESKFPGQHAVQAEILTTVGNAYRGIGDPATAIPLLERALALRQKTFGPVHLNTLAAGNNLARAQHDAGRSDLAIPTLERNLHAFRSRMGSDHPSTLIAQGDLANAYRSAGRFTDALPLYQSTLASRRATLGPSHPETWIAQSNTAIAFQDLGRLDEAIPLFEETLVGQSKLLGNDHPNTLTARNNLATAYVQSKKFAKAIELFEESLRLSVEKLGADHPRTLAIKDNLAGAYRSDRQLDRAIALLEETLSSAATKLGAAHPDTLIIQSNLASAYRANRKLDRAIELFEKTWSARKVGKGIDHPDTLLAQINLAVSCQDAGQLERAMTLLEDAESIRKAKLGADHADTIDVQVQLASVYRGLRRFEPAIELLRSVLDSRRKRLGDDHVDTLATMRTLAATYGSADQLDQQESLQRERLSGLRRRLPDTHSSVVIAFDELGETQLRAKKYVDAEQSLTISFAGLSRLYPGTWGAFDTQSLLGAAQAGQKKFDEAEANLRAGYNGLKSLSTKLPAAVRPRLLAALERLIAFADSNNRPEDAARWRKELTELMK